MGKNDIKAANPGVMKTQAGYQITHPVNPVSMLVRYIYTHILNVTNAFLYIFIVVGAKYSQTQTNKKFQHYNTCSAISEVNKI